jgi:protein-disulfide isomerase
MAGGSNLTKFYGMIGVIAVAGVAWILTQRGDSAPTGLAVAPIDLSGFEGYTIGSPDAPVEMIEFADFQCPACGRHAILTAPDIMQRMVANGTLRLTFKDFPLDIHSNSGSAHMAAACSDEQGKFWEMHDQLFFNQNDWSNERRPARTFRGYAELLGLDVAAFRECMSSQRHLGRFQASIQEGLSMGVASTPSFVINGRLYPGAMAFDRFSEIIDAAAAAN